MALGYNEQDIARQRAIADQLLNKGMSGPQGAGYQGGNVYIKGNNWGNMANALTGALGGRNATVKGKKLTDQRDEELKVHMTNKPTLVDPVTGQQKPPAQMQQEISDWNAQGMQSKNPAVLKMSTKAFENFNKQPYDMQTLQETGKQKSELQTQKAASDVKMLNQRIASAEKRAENAVSSNEKMQYAQIASQAKLQRDRIIQQNVALKQQAEQFDSQLDNPTVTYQNTLNEDGTSSISALPTTMKHAGAPINTGLTPQPTKTGTGGAKAQAARDRDEYMLGQIDEALKLGRERPKSFGIQGIAPGMVLDRVDADGTKPRAATAAISAERIHDLSGAAVTAAERPRMERFIPSPTDNWKTTETKLEGMRRLILMAQQSQGLLGKEDLDKVFEESGMNDLGKTPGGTGGKDPVTITTEEEWKNLDPDTPYIYNGRPGVK